MRDQGAELDDVELRESRENLMRGIYAKKDIPQGDTVMFIPHGALLDKE
jgi:hypothetical protein